MDGITLPAVEYAQSDGGCTVIGGYVYRGAQVPALVGGYVFADYCSGEIFGFSIWMPAATPISAGVILEGYPST